MSRFSPSDAALEGFRLTREKPLTVLFWAVLRLAYGGLGLAVMIGGGWTALMAQISAQGKTPADVEKVLPLLGQLAPTMVLMILAGLVFYAVAYTAVLRAILRPADRSLFYLRLSADELRQLGLALLVFVLFFVYAMVVEIISILLINASKGLGQAALPVDILVILAVIAAFVYPAVRLSLAPAMTFADGRITLFRSLPVTRGQFWPMLGAYVLALILAFVVSLLATVIFVFAVGAVGAAQGGLSSIPEVLGMMQPETLSFAQMMTPVSIAKLVFGALLNTLGYVIMFAPAAAIFRALTGRVGAPATPAKPGQPWG